MKRFQILTLWMIMLIFLAHQSIGSKSNKVYYLDSQLLLLPVNPNRTLIFAVRKDIVFQHYINGASKFREARIKPGAIIRVMYEKEDEPSNDTGTIFEMLRDVGNFFKENVPWKRSVRIQVHDPFDGETLLGQDRITGNGDPFPVDVKKYLEKELDKKNIVPIHSISEHDDWFFKDKEFPTKGMIKTALKPRYCLFGFCTKTVDISFKRTNPEAYVEVRDKNTFKLQDTVVDFFDQIGTNKNRKE